MNTLEFKNRKFYIIFAAIVSSIVVFDVITFVAQSPVLRIAKIETITHPFATKLRADDAYLRLFPLGTGRDAVLEALRRGGFEGFNKGTPVEGKENTEFYFGRANLSAGLFGSLFIIWYEVQITVEFNEGNLSDLRVYIFKSSI